MIRVSSASVLELQDSRFADILSELKAKQASTSMKTALGWIGGGIATLAFLAGGAGGFVAGLFVVGAGIAIGAWLDSFRRTSVLMYGLEDDVLSSYEALTRAFDQLAACSGKWHIDAGGAVRDLHTWKRNAGASHIVDKRPTEFGYSLPKVVRSNIIPPSIKSGKEILYFFPDFLLVVEGKKIGAVAYDNLLIRWDDSNFIEEGTVPSDAVVLYHTWKHPNKDGGPDMRFSNNYQIPVCLYESIHFTSPNGLNELLQVSRSGVSQPFAQSVQSLSKKTKAQARQPTRTPPERLLETETEKPSPQEEVRPEASNEPTRIIKTRTYKENKVASSPFGIEMGSAISSVTTAEDLGQGKFIVEAPKPHPAFTTYLVQASDTHGIVWIKGISPDMPNDSYGNSARAAVEKLQSQLEGRYGPPEKNDILFRDALWSEGRDWTMALVEGERAYFCIWQRPGSPEIPEDLESIFLGASAVDSMTTNMVVEYSSKNLAAAENEIDDVNAELL